MKYLGMALLVFIVACEDSFALAPEVQLQITHQAEAWINRNHLEGTISCDESWCDVVTKDSRPPFKLVCSTTNCRLAR